MLQFETLLLRQLQKQQNRDEFCDTVLHTQGVSVPVHSCVLSAFSPRLCGTLSSMPVPTSGQRRLIELKAVDACTLLSLVSLLYSGHLHENREQVFSAAQTLGIELPQWHDEEEGRGGKVGRRKDSEHVEQDIEKEVDARKWDDKMTRRMDEASRGEKEKKRESGTQTEGGSETDGRGAQPEMGCAEPQNLQTVYVIDQLACSNNQELGIRLDFHDAALAMRAAYPERKSTTFDLLTVAPEAINCHEVSETVALQAHNGFLDQSMVVPVDGGDSVDNLKRYEGNIPGFINHFLNSADSLNTGRSSQVVKRASATTGGGTVKEWVHWMGGGRGGRRRRQMKRWGLVAGLAWRGQGGGRVGRLLETRTTGKNPTKALQRQQGKEIFVEAKEARGRGRHRQRGTNAGSQGQKDPSRTRRPRGRPRVRPLPASRNFSKMTLSDPDTVDPTDLGLLHTVPVAPMEPIDALLDDFMAGLHFLPPEENQTNQQKAVHPHGQSMKSSEPKQHLEGELGDILDHFLRTFDQHVGCCALDVGDEPSQSNAGSYGPDPVTDPWSNTSSQHPHNTHLYQQTPNKNLLHTSSMRGTRPRLRSTVNSSGTKKSKTRVREPEMEFRRLTRSQSLKRKLETAFIGPQNPAKRKRKEKQSANTMKQRQKDRRGQSKARAKKLNNSNKTSKKRPSKGRGQKSRKRSSARDEKSKVRKYDRNKKSVENRSHVMDGVSARKTRRQTLRTGINGRTENVGDDHISNDFQAGRSSAKSQIQETCIELASSAMEKVKMLLQLQDEDEGASPSVETKKKNNEGNGSRKCLLRAKRSPGENSLQGHVEDVQMSEDKDGLKVGRRKQENERRTRKGRRQEEHGNNDCSMIFQLNLASDGGEEGKNDSRASLSNKVTNARSSDQVAASGSHFLRRKIMPSSSQIADNSTSNGGDSSAAQLSHTRPSPGLLGLHTSTKYLHQLAADEEDDVDVLEVSSGTSELLAVSPVILGLDLSTEEEEVEDVEIDVIGLEQD